MLTVEAVTKTYGEGHTAVTAVHEASMEVSQGEFVALLGPSGSGKTTLISMIGGLLTPTSGLIKVGDVAVSDLDSKALTTFRAERVGFVFQSANLVPFLTARENLLWVAGLRKEKGRAARREARPARGPAARGAGPVRARAGTCRRSSPGASDSAWRSAAR